MKILLTGATGYIAQRLLPVLLEEGHEVICCVRDAQRFNTGRYLSKKLRVIETDLLDPESLLKIPDDIDVAYYLVHSMSTTTGDFEEMEYRCARNFRDRIANTSATQVIYLSGIVNEEKLSKHLTSRKEVERILGGSTYALTTLRAGIIVGSGSASFEIIRDLVEKLPVMIAPRWLNTRCQPIAIRNVIDFLNGVKDRRETFDKSYDIGGPDVLSYKQMLLRFARIRKLARRIIIVPVMSPKISSYWLYFVTSTSFSLAQNLVNSMKVEVICTPNSLATDLGIELIGYDDAIRRAFGKIEESQVLSSWKDARYTSIFEKGMSPYMDVPVNGCFRDERSMRITDPEQVLDRIWAIGGKTGWYYGDWLWEIRGLMDQVVGGVGMRRGRRSATEIQPGDALDLWRVLLADRNEKRLLLFAEMKLPGEAWLEFKIEGDRLVQTATFRPLGISGRLYWYALWPMHGLIFQNMLRRIANGKRGVRWPRTAGSSA